MDAGNHTAHDHAGHDHAAPAGGGAMDMGGDTMKYTASVGRRADGSYYYFHGGFDGHIVPGCFFIVSAAAAHRGWRTAVPAVCSALPPAAVFPPSSHPLPRPCRCGACGGPSPPTPTTCSAWQPGAASARAAGSCCPLGCAACAACRWSPLSSCACRWWASWGSCGWGTSRTGGCTAQMGGSRTT